MSDGIPVTPEMTMAAMREHLRNDGEVFEDYFAAIYRAMRALEPSGEVLALPFMERRADGTLVFELHPPTATPPDQEQEGA